MSTPGSLTGSAPLTFTVQGVANVTGGSNPAGATHIPPGILSLPDGTYLKGTINRFDPRRQPVLHTVKGEITLASQLPLKLGQEVVLRLETKADGLHARIITVDGKTPGKIEGMQLQPPVDEISLTQPGTRSPVQGEARPPAAQPQPQGSGTTAEQPAVSVRTSAAAQAMQQETSRPTISATATLIQRAPDLPQHLARLPASITVPATRLQPGAGIQLLITLPSPVGVSQPTSSPQPASPATVNANFASASRAYGGMPLPPTPPPAPAAPPASPAAAPSALPGPLQSSSSPSPAPISTPSSGPGQPSLSMSATPGSTSATAPGFRHAPTASAGVPVWTLTVLQREPDGVVLRSPLGTLHLPSQSLPAATSWHPGQQMMAQPMAITEATVEEAMLPLRPPAVSSFPALEAFADYASHTSTTGLTSVLTSVLPKPDSGFMALVMHFFGALKQPSIERWMGRSHATLLEEAGKSELLARIGGELTRHAASAGELNNAGWQHITVPVWANDAIRYAQFFFHRDREQEDATADGGQAQRFIIELDFDHIGQTQLDGFVRRSGKKDPLRFDLVLRTVKPLAQPHIDGVSAIYRQAADEAGFFGQLSFRLLDPDAPAPWRQQGDGAQGWTA